METLIAAVIALMALYFGVLLFVAFDLTVERKGER